ncbi:FtsK/SpoIIIE domain-containing protein, partial [uncultured Agrococcus sp.]|uniref:FtsK/SpoIIIE domain-containing protein n=1 Tax=uncultured Agrococcus sp. TaxID=382258 RepID=UPI0025E4E55F
MTSRLALPQPPQQPGPASFPLFASLAPVVGALVLFAFMQTPYVLLFAVLGPVIAVASMIDRRIGARKLRKRETARFEEDAELLRVRIRQQTSRAMDAQRVRRPDARELGRRDARHPDRWRWRDGELPVVLGNGHCATGLTLDEPPEPRGVVRELYDELAPLAAVGTGPVCVDAHRGLGFYGPELVAHGLARTAIAQVLDAVSPEQGTVIVEGGERWQWMRETPHNVRFTDRDDRICIVRVLSERGDCTIAVAPEPNDLPRECGLRILASAEEIDVDGVSAVPRTIAQHEAEAHLRRLRESASASGFVTAGTIPESVALDALQQSSGEGLAATFLVATEPVTVDLVADGPHAVVGGTTGSGKSELLVSWVTSLAAGYTSGELNVLLVDFKGGASFGELQGLRHCVGLMT